MTDTSEMRQRGNTLYAAKDYAAALAVYEEALALDPQNIDLHNNITAAHLALERYDAAIASAQRSLAVCENPKAYSRMGSAQWALGLLPEALRSYERCVAHSPSAAGADAARDAAAQLRRLIALRSSGAAPSGAYGAPLARPPRPDGAAGAAVDFAVAALAALVVVVGPVAPRLAQPLWAALLLAVTVRGLFVARGSGLLRADRAALSAWVDHRCTLEALLCGLALLVAAPMQTFLACFMGLYAAASLAANPRAVASAPVLAKLASMETKVLMYAASFEALMLFTVMLSGGALFTLVYIQYVKNMYRIDGNIRFAFTVLRINVSKLTRRPYMPAFVDIYMQKFCDLLYKLSEGSF